jgi:hypothetical protein
VSYTLCAARGRADERERERDTLSRWLLVPRETCGSSAAEVNTVKDMSGSATPHLAIALVVVSTDVALAVGG